MEHWNQRPEEEAYLFNPAFCCTILTSSIIGYNEFNTKGMHFPLCFLVLPIILHRPTRNSLPDLRSSLASWMLKNSKSRILLPERTIAFKPFTKEALLFGFQHKWIELDQNGHFKSDKEAKIDKALKILKEDANKCVKDSRFLGRWFAKAGPAENVMTMWGVRP